MGIEGGGPGRVDDNFGSGVALGHIYDALPSFASEAAILSDQSLALGLLSGPLLPPFVTAIACGDDGDEESRRGGEFNRPRCPANLGAQKVQVVIVQDHQRVLSGLDRHVWEGAERKGNAAGQIKNVSSGEASQEHVPAGSTRGHSIDADSALGCV